MRKTYHLKNLSVRSFVPFAVKKNVFTFKTAHSKIVFN
ncbi:hypothetical protein SRABI04_00743 [Chryseobacterium sp. Bi04]|nr:hypothetical protein SRABI04_00743 [Chryseobacterium sp. Bi04]